MSQVLETQAYLIPTVIGSIAVRMHLVQGYDVDDAVHAKAVSQARLIQYNNIGATLQGQAAYPQASLPAVFQAGS